MIQTSDKYKEYIKKRTRYYELEIEVKTKNGTLYKFNKKGIVKGSFNMMEQCSSNQEVQIGSVYSSELSVTLISNVDRYSLYDAIIKPYFVLDMEGIKESIPLGVFNVKEPNRQIAYVELVAYDNMIKFDKSFNNTSMIGMPYDFISVACIACGVELEATKEQIEAMPNGKETVSIYEDNDIESWRDIIHYVTQMLGAFASINRYGKLRIKQYGDNVVNTIKKQHRFKSSFSDFATRYTGLYFTNLRTSITEYISQDIDDGLTMNIGSNPFLQYGVDDVREKRLRNILNSISKINYVPFDATIVSDPSLECGDIIRFSEGHADENAISCITSLNFNYGKDFTISGSGKNPILKDGKSKTDKNILGLIGNSSKNELVSYSFTNAKGIKIENTFEEIVALMYVTKSKTSVEFKASIIYKLECEGKSIIKFRYESDDNAISTHMPIDTKERGMYTSTLYYPLSGVKEQTEHKFRVFMSVDNGFATIERFGVVANLNGQGLVSNVMPWDGKINIEEVLDEIVIEPLKLTEVEEFNVSLEPSCIMENINEFNISIDEIVIDQLQQTVINEFEYSMKVGNRIYSNTIGYKYDKDFEYDRVLLKNIDGISLNTEITLESETGTIDDGNVYETNMTLSELVIINSIEEV